MKILLSFLIIIIILLIILYIKSKNKTVEGFFNIDDTFKKIFPGNLMTEEYKFFIRESGDFLENYIVPSNFKYTYLKNNLVELINRNIVTIIRTCQPTLTLKFTIPDEFNNTYMRYKISIDQGSISTEYNNFLFYKYFKLDSNSNNLRDNSLLLTDNLDKLNKIKNLIEENNVVELSEHDKNYNLIYELPTRLEGDCRDDNKQIMIYMIMFYFKFKIEVDVYSPEKINDDVFDNLKLGYENFMGEKEIVRNNLSTESISKFKIQEIGSEYILNLYPKFLEILTEDADTVDIENQNSIDRLKIEFPNMDGLTIRAYIYEDTTKPFHSKKIKKIVEVLLLYFSKKISEKHNSDNKIGEDNDESILENILKSYVTEDAGLVSPFTTFMQNKYQPNFTAIQKLDENRKKEHQLQYLDENKILGNKFLDEYEKLSPTFQQEIQKLKIDIISYIVNINNQIKNSLKEKDLYKTTLTYKLDLSSLSPQKTVTLAPQTDLSDEEKEINKLKNMDSYERLLYLVQKDLRKVLRNRRGNFFDQNDFKISNELKKELLVYRKNLTSTSELKRKNAEKNIDYIKFLMDMIKIGNVKIIKEIVDYDVSKNRFLLIDKLEKIKARLYTVDQNINNSDDMGDNTQKTEVGVTENFNSYSGGMGTYVKGEKYKENFKKNMDDIYKRYMKFKITADENKRKYDERKNGLYYDDNTYEDFNNLVQHKHVDSGQINFLRGAMEVSRDDFEKSEWLKKPENQRLVSNYQFLSDGQKKGIIKEIDDMETNMILLKDFTDTNYGEMKEKLNLLEAKAKEEIRLREEEENMSDLDRAMRDFQFKEQEQEAKMKSMNEKIDKLEKEQKGLNLARFDKINSVRSMGDGHVLSVFNLKDNEYQIQANSGCVTQGKKSLQIDKCGNQKKQKFNLHHINNNEEYNKHLPTKSHIIPEYDEISYPFHLITTTDNNKKCVSMYGNRMSLADCADSKYHRFETLQKFKKCDSKYGN